MEIERHWRTAVYDCSEYESVRVELRETFTLHVRCRLELHHWSKLSSQWWWNDGLSQWIILISIVRQICDFPWTVSCRSLFDFNVLFSCFSREVLCSSVHHNMRMTKRQTMENSRDHGWTSRQSRVVFVRKATEKHKLKFKVEENLSLVVARTYQLFCDFSVWKATEPYLPDCDTNWTQLCFVNNKRRRLSLWEETKVKHSSN